MTTNPYEQRARELAWAVLDKHKCGLFEAGISVFDAEAATKLLAEFGAVCAREAALPMELRELSEKATPGEWYVDIHKNILQGGKMVAFPCISGGLPQKENAQFIVACVNYVRRALAIPESTPVGEKSGEQAAGAGRAEGQG